MTKNILFFVSSILFSFLFYDQNIGLNFLIFSFLSIALIGFFYPSHFDKKSIPYVLGFLLSGISVFLYANPLSMITYFFSFFIFLGSIYETKSSLFVKLINGLYTSIAGIFELQYKRLNDRSSASKIDKKKFDYWLKMIGIPTTLLIIFGFLYYQASTSFALLIGKLDLSIINLDWIVFTLFGFGIIVNFTALIPINGLTVLDLNSSNNLVKTNLKTQTKDQIIQEHQLGSILISMLILLISVFIISDLIALIYNDNPSAHDLSNAVHSGIYALIGSIVLVIVIILYFFRGNLNYYKQNRQLKLLTVLWIGFNLIIVLITAYKNYNYINFHGLTYKRIGVFVYLILAAIGLITTLIKVNSKYNLWFLTWVNVKTAFAILLVSSMTNWDRQITSYNINSAQHIDIEYLLSLSNNNTYYLYDHINQFPLALQQRIQRRYDNYSTTLANYNWQELVYDNLKNTNE